MTIAQPPAGRDEVPAVGKWGSFCLFRTKPDDGYYYVRCSSLSVAAAVKSYLSTQPSYTVVRTYQVTVVFKVPTSPSTTPAALAEEMAAHLDAIPEKLLEEARKLILKASTIVGG